MRSPVFRSLLVVSIAVGVPHAALGPWESLGGPSGATCMAFDGGTNTLLVGTVSGFQYYAIDEGAWTDREEEGSIGREVWAILAHPTVPGRILTGRQNAFFKGYLEFSPDWGITHFPVWISQGGKLTELQADPFNPDVMYACGWHDISPGDLLRSSDGGMTWVQLPSHLHYAMTDLATDPQVPGRIYVSGDALVTRSDDGGDTWVQVANGLPATLGVYCVAVSPHNSHVLLCANDNGIYRSDDGASSWRHVEGAAARRISFNPGVPGMASAVTFSPYRLMVSWDWGAHWVDRTDWPTAMVGVDLAFPPEGDRLFLATSQNGVFVRSVTTPISLTIRVEGPEVRLEWTSDYPFALYRVYRSTSPWGGFAPVIVTPGMTYSEPIVGERFFYRVTGE